jgi:prepilin-type processing-associated H-X9-DG protein
VYRGALFRSRAGISIIELLVIIAVIAVLAGMLFPIFGTAKRTSHRAQCASNLKQFAIAFNLYANDWNGYWPCPGGLAGDWTYWSQSGKGGLNPYVRQQGNQSIWCCPSMPKWPSRYPPRSYTMNSYLRQDPLGRTDIEYPSCINYISGVKISKIDEPRKTILLFEGLPLTYGWENVGYYIYIYRCCNWTGVRGFSPLGVACTVDADKPWHGPLNNYLYCDGHIVARKPGRGTTTVLSTYSEMYQWYVSKATFEENYSKHWSHLIPRE